MLYFMSLSNCLQKTVKVFLFLLCFSAGFNLTNSSKSGIELFPAVFAEDINKEQAAKAIWKIQIGIDYGSGFFISENKIVTNFHVVRYAESAGLENITLVQEGNPNQLKVKRIASLSIRDDLAILEIEGAVSNFLSLPSGDLLNSSKKLYILGYPGGRFQEINQTSVLKEGGFLIDISDIKGASGGPILNDSHQLAGVLSHAMWNLVLSFVNAQTLNSFKDSENCKNLNFTECFRSSRETFEQFKQEAQEVEDYFIIAVRYYIGLGVEQDFVQAKKWLEEPVDQDDAQIQFLLGGMYYFEQGTEKNLDLAIELMKKSANQDYVPAQYILAIIYMKEKEVLAKKRMKDSAAQDYAPAQYESAIMYYKVLAKKRMKDSAAQGYAPAQYELAIIYYNEGRMDLVREWMEKSARHGYAPAKKALKALFR